MSTLRARGSLAGWGAVGAAFVLALLVVAAPGQQAEPPDTKVAAPDAGPPAENGAEEPKEADEPVHIEHADLMSYDPEKNLYFLSGNVHFRHKDTHLYCDEAQYNEDEDTARATGNLKLVQPETTVTGDLITADFGEEVADITGNVRLLTQKKKAAEAPAEGGAAPKAGEQPANGKEENEGRFEEYKQKLTTVTCQQIRYWYEEKRALATGDVVAEQEDKKVYADEAEYVEKDDLLTLKGNPVKAIMENGNQFTTPWVKVEVEGERFWTGGFSGTFKKEKKEEEKPAEGRAAPPTEPPTAPSPPPAPSPDAQPKAP